MLMKRKYTYDFEAKVWLYPGDVAWHFVSVPTDIAQHIHELPRPTRRGFGAIRVEVTLGDSIWQTSIFPDTRSKSYLLPIKSSIRKHEGVYAGDVARISLCIL